ncbi:alpha/beta fold hydrolase [Xylophilus ampelinus]|uniref:Pimeloyl-ACP methyl ester carboxylesterase n=1 Tax=Xylophilus ampelinus TaxID=54067 RepID=A0A318SGP3_9BURK|nr:alpha/beta hydrolase [Xylophilus ampelinus]MCS4510578.1 alpha/beta hydrolase [Xylophilus ampelinus]PYE77795.1 pimeloyl-ACP methyl ester carboxylesterase [Xylophilus ampelinus]
MPEPRLHHVTCPGLPGAPRGAQPHDGSHRMAYWEWGATGDPAHSHVVVCVHGLSRQGRDFDVLARALAPHVRVVCPDVVGRGRSDWLQDPMDYGIPLYAADMLALLAQLQAAAPIRTLDWVGTSMGGLIGMVVAGQPGLPVPVPVRRMVLNDVGPAIEWDAVQRISAYLGVSMVFASAEEGAAALRAVSRGFGPHADDEWAALSGPMFVPADGADAAGAEPGAVRLHYDAGIAAAVRALTPEVAAQSEALLWTLYDRIGAETLLLRGAQSDLLSRATADAMARRGPRARVVEFAGVGHAPTLVAADQVTVVRDFLLGDTVPA